MPVPKVQDLFCHTAPVTIYPPHSTTLEHPTQTLLIHHSRLPLHTQTHTTPSSPPSPRTHTTTSSSSPLHAHTRTSYTTSFTPHNYSLQAGGTGAVVTGYENIIAVWESSFSSLGPIPSLKTKEIKLNFQVLCDTCSCVFAFIWCYKTLILK